eukprot:11048733-Lingulodinium_polyedra.AAC.1
MEFGRKEDMRMAALARSKSEKQLREQLDEETQRLEFMRSRMASQEDERPPLLLSNCKLTDSDLA